MKVIDLTPYFHSRSGGIRTYLLEKANFLGKNGINHVLIIPGKEKGIFYHNMTKVYQVSSIPIYFSGGYRFFSNFKEIKEILEIEKPDLIELGGTYLPVNFLISPRYKLLVFYHSDIEKNLALLPLPDQVRKKIAEQIVLRTLAKADLVFTPSIKQTEYLQKYNLKNIRILNLGVDTTIFNYTKRNSSVRKSLNISEDKIVITYVGRFSPEKNIKILLKIIEKLEPSKFEILLVGDGPLRKKVETITRRYSWVRYLGFIPSKEELSRIYGTSDLFLSTSNTETFGLTFLEAQACGCVLIAQDLGLESQPFKEFLVTDGSIKGFLEKINYAIRSLTPQLREKISSHICQKFSWENTFERLISFYQSLL